MRDPTMEESSSLQQTAVTDGDAGGDSGDGGAAAPVVGEEGEVVVEVRQSEVETVVVSAAVEGDGGEWYELDRAPGELQLRRRAVMLKAAAPAIPGRREDVREVRAVEGFRLTRFEGRGILTRVRTDDRLRRSTARSKGGGRELRCVLG